MTTIMVEFVAFNSYVSVRLSTTDQIISKVKSLILWNTNIDLGDKRIRILILILIICL